MGTLATSNKGFIVGASSTSYSAAINGTTGTATNGASGNATSMQYFQSAGRGGGTFRFIRTFLYWNTQAITAGSDFTIQLTSYQGSNATNNRIMAIRHNAGGSNGGTITNNDFNNIIRNEQYSGITTYASSGTVTIALNAAAVSRILSSTHFNVALLLAFDATQEEESPLSVDGAISNGISFGSAINLVYTDAAGYGNSVAGLAAASISKVVGLEAADINKVIGS